ncbi:hypothetical protein [Streptomyces sp. A5-4]|uniref:hypothetical protein n=1 Tax=Streptomyces sp. A5-4 TaxID=3384771 RepID=UPI003DA863A3
MGLDDPGLGNVYDAAVTGVPTLWLPGANETHDLQVRLLFEHGCCDALVGWDDIGRSVDYLASPPEVGRQITRVVQQAFPDRSLRERLTGLLARRTAELGGQVVRQGTGARRPLRPRRRDARLLPF